MRVPCPPVLVPALIALGGLVLAAADPPASPAFPAPGEWPCYRRTAALDAHSPGTGRIQEPSIAWRQFIGALESLIVIEPGADSTRLSLPADESTETPGTEPFALSNFIPSPASPEDDNSSPTTQYADVLPEEPGNERIEFESGFAKPTVNGQWQPCVGRCFARRQGQWVEVWATAPLDYLFQPLPLVGDFNHDGRPDIAILPFYELLLLDASTGRVTDRCRFTDTRSYGFFGAYDLDHDGRTEFVVQADFSKHVDVLGFREGKLGILWQIPVEPDISNPQKILRVGPSPVADVDGDGRDEVLTTIFNHAGDQRWWLTVHDGLTGRVLGAFQDEYLAAAVDLDADGASELLTVRTAGAGVPDFGHIAVRSMKAGASGVLWEQNRSAWQSWEPPLPRNVKTTATFGRQTVMVRQPEPRAASSARTEPKAGANIVIRRAAPHGAVELSLAAWRQNRFHPVTTVVGEGLEALGLDDAGRLLVKCTHSPGARAELRLERGHARLQWTRRAGITPGPVVVARPESAPEPVILVQSASHIVAFPPQSATRQPVIPARLQGRGQSTSWPEARGPVVADLVGDGRRQLVSATSGPSGCARLLATDLAGSERWHHDFASFPGTPPVWNTGGLILWQTGHFTHRHRLDVVVTLRRSMMHSEETFLLSGVDGRELWHRDRQVSQRGVGGTPFAVADYNRDGLDDVASLHPSILYLLEGATGRDLLARDATWDAVPAKPVYWGQPIAGDFLGRGQADLFFAGRSMTGVVRADGSLVWWDALDHAGQDYPAFGEFTGNHRQEAIGFGYPDGIRCYDTATGKVLWRLPMPTGETVIGTASADLDGDARDEAVAVAGQTLFCVGPTPDGLAGTIRWKLRLPAAGGPPTLAALEADQRLAILIACADGFVCCVK